VEKNKELILPTRFKVQGLKPGAFKLWVNLYHRPNHPSLTQNPFISPNRLFRGMAARREVQQRKKKKKLHLTPGNLFDDYILSSASQKMDDAAIHAVFEGLQSSSSYDLNVKGTWLAWVDLLTTTYPKGVKRKVCQIEKMQEEDYKKSTKALTNATVNPVNLETIAVDVLDLEKQDIEKQAEEEEPKKIEQQKPENPEKITNPFLAFKHRRGGKPE
jgi:hypothetical protein